MGNFIILEKLHTRFEDDVKYKVVSYYNGNLVEFNTVLEAKKYCKTERLKKGYIICKKIKL